MLNYGFLNALLLVLFYGFVAQSAICARLYLLCFCNDLGPLMPLRF